jgi:parallel beta-helix repeat protein
VVKGNYIGNTGTSAMANQGAGIHCSAGSGLLVGGLGAADGNVISGNGSSGIEIAGTCSNAVVWGNRIGTNAVGSAAIPNLGSGIRVWTPDHVIGGTGGGMANQISGNVWDGVATGDETSGVTIQANRIGTNAAGSAAIPNGSAGINLGGDGHLVGGTVQGAGNIVSGNALQGITIREGADGNTVQGNKVGTNHAGSAAIANGGDGFRIYGADNQVGGASSAAVNLVSGSAYGGLYLGPQAHDNRVQGNRIGTNAAGTAAIPNTWQGIRVDGDDNEIGGDAFGEGNLISGNGSFGVGIDTGATGNVVAGNRIGTTADGHSPLGNGGNGVSIWGAGNEIGGDTPLAANLVSGNAYGGFYLGSEAHGNRVQGNRIGTNVTGTAAMPNAGQGIRVDGDDNEIGGDAAGEGNLISGNGDYGVGINGEGTGNVVAGNRIGTTADGNAPLGNGGNGISLWGAGNRIGGDTPLAVNLISANAYNGIGISGEGCDDNEIVGNRIGTNAAGTAAIGNHGYGIRALDGAGTTILRNLISGNDRGLSLEGGSSDGVVQGNVIGLDAAMTAKLANGWSAVDIGGSGHRIGGTGAGEANVLAGNDHSGVWLNAHATGNVIEGNLIGTNPAGTAGLGNGQPGIMITEASGNTIGGTEPGAGNTIAHNGYLGIYVWSGQGNAILGNSIHDNELLGIDLEPQGPVPNDLADSDAGPNRGQNYPVVTSAEASGSDLAIDGFLRSRAATEYRIELFSNPSFDATGVGEGHHFLGATTVTTDISGYAAFSVALPAAGGDAFVTATATSPVFDTSEFSPAIAVGAPQPGQLQIWRDLLLSYEGTPGIEVSIVRSHGVAGTVSVDVLTVEDTALAPEDFGALDQTLVFQPGEVMKTVFVPIVTDGLAEADEKWRLKLESPQGGVSLGAQHDVLAWLFNATLEWPIYTIGNAAVLEGDDGTRTATFTVTLSATDHPVPIEWWTSDGTAVAGEDYVEGTGLLDFQPGQGSKTITVEVLGDTDVEDDEIFYVHLYAQANAVVWDGLGDGRILDDDDDGGGPSVLHADDFEAGSPQGWSNIVGMP